MKNLCLFALLSLTACKLPHPQQFALDMRVTVELPAQPHAKDTHKNRKLKHPERMKVWILHTLGGTYHLIRTVNPDMNISVRDTLERDAYYTRKVKALVARKAQILVSRAFTVAGIKGRDITYESHAAAKPMLVYSRSLVLDSVGYALDFFPTFQAKKGILSFLSNEQRRRFFNSITIKP